IVFVGDRGYGFGSDLLKIVEKDGKESLKTINTISVCSNTTCILNLAKQSYKPRGSLSVLTIGISGAFKQIDSILLCS
ncbi:hypothetical protein EDC96DRAFT_453498, partial [Choanephora cucurbitarum]